jgi:endonuclease/exonuclease/phosphatase family metal-dependent hydrolase
VIPARPPDDSVRVLVLNLWGNDHDWPKRRAVIADGIREVDPDLIALVECVRTAHVDQAAEVLPSGGYHVIDAAIRDDGDHGAAIVSRWPISRVHERDLRIPARTADFPACLLVVEVEAPSPFGRIVFGNLVPSFQPDFELEREHQAVAAARFVEDLRLGADGPELPHVILAGDLTADPDCASVRFLTGRQSLDGFSVCYRDAWASANRGRVVDGDTFVPDNPLVADWDWPFRRLDYVLVRCLEHGGPSLHVAACRRVFDRPVDGVWASDHFGVVADLVMPPRR